VRLRLALFVHAGRPALRQRPEDSYFLLGQGQEHLDNALRASGKWLYHFAFSTTT
jgi:hypothetical protein